MAHISVSSLCCSTATQMSEDILKMNQGPLGEFFVLAFMQPTTHSLAWLDQARLRRQYSDVNMNSAGY